MKTRLGFFRLQTVGKTIFLEDAYRHISIDIRMLIVNPKEVSALRVAEFIVAACNAYDGKREVGKGEKDG